MSEQGGQRPRLEVANADFVTDRLAVGGDLSFDPEQAAAQRDDLLAAGVTHVLDVRIEASDEGVWDGTGVTYRHDGIDDAGQQVPGAWFEANTAWAVDALEADPDARVLTHCHMGVNRGPSVGYAVLLRQGWDPVEAFAAVCAARDVAFVDYADDALAWHHERTGASAEQREGDQARLDRWRSEHQRDMGELIRRTRQV